MIHFITENGKGMEVAHLEKGKENLIWILIIQGDSEIFSSQFFVEGCLLLANKINIFQNYCP